ncbi:TY-Chap domain-containing protein [Streptomyces sp. NPDC093105]|uniref:TY-Chap domain-containing protein n=1 Tax=Streptomyces sp. NPDC093105 TaxID=3366029 RepID=UPI00380C16CA
MTGWDGFQERLAEQLASLPAGAVVIVSETGAAPPTKTAKGSRYAQFRQDPESLYAELSGDRHLEGAARAGDEGGRLLVAAGWRAPDADDRVGNWCAELPWPSPSVAYRRLASMVVTGLHVVFRVPAPSSLAYTAWDAEDGNRPLELPLLGLAREG